MSNTGKPVIPHQTPPPAPNTRPCIEPTCTLYIDARLLCCPPHWSRLPADIRELITDTNQKRRRHPLPHLRAVGMARQWMKANPPPLTQ